MFKSLDIALDRKKKQLQKIKALNKDVKSLVNEFISQNFSQSLEIFSLKSIKNEKGVLFIEFNNKAVSNEIKIRSTNLVNFLRSKGVSLNSLVIK